ncbi:hypothetical protein SAMN05880501_104137 [Ureibacillus xyleni]|uniref:DUF2071 domain-containing protein n=2 Tax=Ureibacillus xyleni TaxID=614648 RepID=A0A285SDK2_9BACL|nr:hypothetical protein SAMN05880501_104137 [Ureibacillus xyleni]
MVINRTTYESRKFELPKIPWMLKQTWENSLFIHYPVKKELLEQLIPLELSVDTFNGVGWVTIVPYYIRDQRGKGMPPVPGISEFPGYNLRTYVKGNGKPGVYFFYLAAANIVAARLAKTFFRLPYKFEKMKMSKGNEGVHFESNYLKCQYEQVNNPFSPKKGSLDEWLLERYCLYTVSKGVVFQCNIVHPSWVLYEANVEFHHNTFLSKYKIEPLWDKPVLHFSKRAEVNIWPLVPVKMNEHFSS